jgi:hypothetical protein
MESRECTPSTTKEEEEEDTLVQKSTKKDASQTDGDSSEDVIETEETAVIESKSSNNEGISEEKTASLLQEQKEVEEDCDCDKQPLADIKEVARSLSLHIDTDDLHDTVDGASAISTPAIVFPQEEKEEEIEEILSPFLYFTHALREESNRSKLCLAVGSCMNEISQIEEIFGKQILKVRRVSIHPSLCLSFFSVVCEEGTT